MAEILEYDGITYVKSEEGYRGKKAEQVAKILEELMQHPNIPFEFEALCETAGAKYPQDVIAAAMTLHMTELVDLYRETSGNRKLFVVWTDP
jgi:hypothetical protein